MAPEDDQTTSIITIDHSSALDHLRPLAEQAREYLKKPISDATKRAYETDWRNFESWCEGNGISVDPPSSNAVLLYVTYLANEGAKVKTIQRAVAGIRSTYEERKTEWFIPDEIRLFFKNLRRQRAEAGERTTKKYPISDDMLLKMVGYFGTDLVGLRDRAIILLGWTGAFRRSEVVERDVADVKFVPEGMVVYLGKSKTDQEGRGLEKGIPLANNPALCATRALRTWLDAANITYGPLFRGVTREGRVREGRLNDHAVAKIVKSAAKKAGFDEKMISGHSLRAGLATTARRAGKSMEDIRNQTGHKSDEVLRGYIREADLFTNNGAKGLL